MIQLIFFRRCGRPPAPLRRPGPGAKEIASLRPQWHE
jgi:hypothetical protein